MLIKRIVLYKALKETLEEYVQNTSLNGFGLLYYIRRRKFQSLFWFLFILLGCSFSIYVVYQTLTNFMAKPTVTTLAAVKETIWDIPFPAIGVCSANKLSRRKVEDFAKKLAYFGRHEKYWLWKLRLFGGYYDQESIDFDEAGDLEVELNNLLGKEYSSLKVLKHFAVDCEDLLIECHLAGRKEECGKLFKKIMTISGTCCVFNHQGAQLKRSSVSSSSSKVYYPQATGIDMGLVLLLNASTGDYFYNTRSTNGFHLPIFDIHGYPDTSVGNVRELIIPPDTDTEAELLITVQSISDEARSLGLHKRRCYFEDENSLNGYAYSSSECLSMCRARSIQDLCECLPFYEPPEYLESIQNLSACSLMDLDCMSNFFVTWRTYRPTEFQGTGKLQQEAIVCPYCYPLCGFKRYNYRKQSVKLSKSRYMKRNRKYLSKLTNDTSELSLVKLYFRDQYATVYKKKVLYNWYQILSSIGGVIGISIGCSIISGFEVFYFLTYRLFMNILKQRRVFAQT